MSQSSELSKGEKKHNVGVRGARCLLYKRKKKKDNTENEDANESPDSVRAFGLFLRDLCMYNTPSSAAGMERWALTADVGY